MHFFDHGPHRLAEVVLRALALHEAAPVIEPELLMFFFDVLYEASFRSDSGRSMTGSVLWQDPATLPAACPAAEKQGCSYLSLTHPVPFNVNTLVSLTQGVDPQVSTLAVYAADPQRPVIHGIVSYGAASFASNEDESPRPPPFSFRAAILGPAHLTVDVGLDQPVELVRNQLYTDAHDVLRRGPVREKLSSELSGLLSTLKAQLAPDIVSSLSFEAEAFSLAGGSILINENDWSEILERLWADALVQLLLHILQGRQGGAVLVTPGRAAGQTEQLLTLPFATGYSQLRLALEQRVLFAMTQQAHSVQTLSEWTRPLQEMPLDDLALHEPDLMTGPPGTDESIRQSGAFIASLAGIEGILLLTPQLDLHGFGGQSRTDLAPDEVYLAGDETATETELTAISYRSFGPRNQALIRHCYQDHDAIAFAFTRDGDLRAMIWLEGKVVVWNRVGLHRL